jgi:hypothetical protein
VWIRRLTHLSDDPMLLATFADSCQIEKFLFAEAIFRLLGKLPINQRLVPQVIIPIHVFAHKTSSNGRKRIILVWVREWSPQLLKDPSQQDTWLVSLQDDASFHQAGAFPDG